ncbi:FkbM family methyltransferase [Flavobacterium jumunjinense]
MYYKNFFTRFVFRKNFFKRAKMRFLIEKRKLFKNEYLDLVFLYQKLDRDPNVIFDCGANIGFVSNQFSNKFPNSLIYAFEPNPTVFEVLKSSIKKEKINPFNMGIGFESGKLKFYKNNNTGTSSFLEPNDFHKAHLARMYQEIEVPVISINDFCKAQKIDEIGILKLDIEGYELKALEGCVDMLENQKIDFIYAEVNLIPTYDGQCLMEEVIAFLRSVNYIPYNFYGNNETELRESIITNILFMSPKVANELNDKYGKDVVYSSSKK